jgi:hypothetical protein
VRSLSPAPWKRGRFSRGRGTRDASRAIDLGMGVLRYLPQHIFAIDIRHPVFWFDLLLAGYSRVKGRQAVIKFLCAFRHVFFRPGKIIVI